MNRLHLVAAMPGIGYSENSLKAICLKTLTTPNINSYDILIVISISRNSEDGSGASAFIASQSAKTG